MEACEVIVRCGDEEIMVGYPELFVDHKCQFDTVDDLYRAVGKAVEASIQEMNKKHMDTIQLSVFRNLPIHLENVGDLCFLTKERKQLVCGVGEVVFLKRKVTENNVHIEQRLIVEDEHV